jgi:hypothetical protein
MIRKADAGCISCPFVSVFAWQMLSDNVLMAFKSTDKYKAAAGLSKILGNKSLKR